MSIASMLDRSLTIRRATVSQSASGAPERTFEDLAAGVMFSVAPASDRLIESYGRRSVRIDYVLWTNVLPVPVKLNDVIVDSVTGESFNTLGPAKKYSNAAVSAETLFEIHCQTTD